MKNAVSLGFIFFSFIFCLSNTVRQDLHYSLRSENRSICLDVFGQGMNEGNGFWLDSCDKFPQISSMYRFVPLSVQNEYRIIAAHSDLALTAAGKGKNVIQKKVSDSPDQILILESAGSDRIRLKFKSSGLYLGIWGGEFRQGALAVEADPASNGSDIFVLSSELSFSEMDQIKKAKSLSSEAQKLIRAGDTDKGCGLMSEASEGTLNDGWVLYESGYWLLHFCGKAETALTAAEKAVRFQNVRPAVLALLTNIYSSLQKWEAALKTADESLNFWKDQTLKTGADSASIKNAQNELAGVYGRKANIYNQKAEWEKAVSTADVGFSLFPDSSNPELIYAKCEPLHIEAGQKLSSDDYSSSMVLIQKCIDLYERNKSLSSLQNGRYKDLKLALSLLAKRKKMGSVVPVTVQKTLGFIVSEIDIDQEIRGTRIRAKDRIRKDQVYRLQAGQQWFRLYIEVMTEGKLSIQFKNTEAGKAVRLNVTVLKEPSYILEIDPDSISPSIDSVLLEHQNWDNFIFYWNGQTSGINKGTGIGMYSWPFTMAGINLGQPRGWSVMGTNPEMYGVFDWLLHHEYGHLLEAMSQISFVHCNDLTEKDKLLPVYSSWDKNCSTIYDWVLKDGFRKMYGDLNWSRRYPANITQEDLQKMKKSVKSN